jgi:hypothetical protein
MKITGEVRRAAEQGIAEEELLEEGLKNSRESRRRETRIAPPGAVDKLQPVKATMKTAGYLTPPMRFLLRREQTTRMNFCNALIDFLAPR